MTDIVNSITINYKTDLGYDLRIIENVPSRMCALWYVRDNGTHMFNIDGVHADTSIIPYFLDNFTDIKQTWIIVKYDDDWYTLSQIPTNRRTY